MVEVFNVPGGGVRRRRGSGLLALICLLGLLFPGAAQAWWNKDWAFRQQVILDATASGVPLQGNLNEVPVVVRLHTGNFSFAALRDDGADLRFIAQDDVTPLTFHVERFDWVSELAIVRVMVPALSAGEKLPVWVYYGNPEATPASDKKAVQDKQTVLALDFERLTGLPQDRTSYGNNAVRGSAKPVAGGAIGDGLAFTPDSAAEVPSAPSLAFPAGGTVAFWVRADKAQDGAVLTLGAAGGPALAVGFRGDGIEAQLRGPGGATLGVAASGPTPFRTWRHVAATLTADTLTLYIDGEAKGSAKVATPALAGPVLLGAAPGRPGFTGSLDEVEVSNVARSAGWLQAVALGSGPEGRLVSVGATEQKSQFSAYLGLLATIAASVSVDGWVIIMLIGLLAALCLEVAVVKSLTLDQMDKGDKSYLALTGGSTASHTDDEAMLARSPLCRIARVGRSVRAGAAQADLLRSAIGRALIEEANRLNKNMVLLTLTISGAPFLGLLGTVVGVMITFAAIAASGDVNVNTIAPGISAAIATTVAGLIVAIPAMFAYNILTTRIRDRLSTMEVFGEEVVSRIIAGEGEAGHAVQA